MTGLTRALRVDLTGFESHVLNLLSRKFRSGIAADDLWGDVRANAYGHGLDLITPVLRRSGIVKLVEDETVLDAIDATLVLEADEMYGVARGGGGFTTFVGEVANVKHVPAGRRVSYGYTYETAKPTTLALVGLGYADGAARRASNTGHVTVKSSPNLKSAPVTGRIAGRIAMDQLVVDLDGEHDIPVGAEAVLWSTEPDSQHTVASWSVATGIPSLALISQVGYRVSREALS